MTVKELKNFLGSLDKEFDDCIVVVSSTEELNSFIPASSIQLMTYIKESLYAHNIISRERIERSVVDALVFCTKTGKSE